MHAFCSCSAAAGGAALHAPEPLELVVESCAYLGSAQCPCELCERERERRTESCEAVSESHFLMSTGSCSSCCSCSCACRLSTLTSACACSRTRGPSAAAAVSDCHESTVRVDESWVERGDDGTWGSLNELSNDEAILVVARSATEGACTVRSEHRGWRRACVCSGRPSPRLS